MSQSAKGFINSIPGASGRFTTSFYVNHSIFYDTSRNFVSTVPEFYCSNATLKYEDVGDITSTRSFSARVDINDISLTSENGPTVTGKLNMPINPPSCLDPELWQLV